VWAPHEIELLCEGSCDLRSLPLYRGGATAILRLAEASEISRLKGGVPKDLAKLLMVVNETSWFCVPGEGCRAAIDKLVDAVHPVRARLAGAIEGGFTAGVPVVVKQVPVPKCPDACTEPSFLELRGWMMAATHLASQPTISNYTKSTLNEAFGALGKANCSNQLDCALGYTTLATALGPLLRALAGAAYLGVEKQTLVAPIKKAGGLFLLAGAAYLLWRVRR